MIIWLDKSGNRIASALGRAIDVDMSRATGSDSYLLNRLLELDRKRAQFLVDSAVDRCATTEECRRYISAGIDRAERVDVLLRTVERFEQLDSNLMPEEWREIDPNEVVRFWHDWSEAEIELGVLLGTASPIQMLRARLGKERAAELWQLVTESCYSSGSGRQAEIDRLILRGANANNPDRYIRCVLEYAAGKPRRKLWA